MSPVLLHMAIGACLIAPADAELPAAAQQRHEEGLAALDRGELARADASIEAAYAEVDRGPEDALTFRAGRDLLLSSRRVVLRRLATATNDHRPLCRLRVFLERHRSALVRALGEQVRDEDTQGIDQRIREVDEALAGGGGAAACVEAAPVVTRSQVVAAAKPPPVAVPPGPRQPGGDVERAVRWRRAGLAVLASSAVPLGMMAFAIVRVERDARRIGELDARIEQMGRPATAEESAQADRWYRDGAAFRAVAIASGLVGAVMTYSGVGLLIRARKMRGPARMAWAPAANGVVWSAAF